MKKQLLSALVASTLLVPALTYAAPLPQKPAPHHAGHAVPAKTEPRKDTPPAPIPHTGHKAHHIMRVAERLAAIETAIGIRSDQLDIWRKYTSSYIDMVTPQRPVADALDDDDASNSNPEAKDRTPPPPADDELILGERMADHVIDTAKRAEVFKQAAADLRKVLDEKQLQRLIEFSKPPMRRGMMMPHPEMKPRGPTPEAPRPAPIPMQQKPEIKPEPRVPAPQPQPQAPVPTPQPPAPKK